MDLGLTGNTALITGAASGIGLATAHVFAEEGCSLLLWDISPLHGDALVSLRDRGVDVDTSVVDIAQRGDLERAFATHLESGKTLDHVVHCAAIGSGEFGYPFTRVSPTQWRRVWDVNVLGTVNLAHVVTPYFVAQRKGTFVFLASVAGQIGSQTDPPYSASKAANINFAQCMAKDLAPHGVRVNTVCPGMVKTALNRSVWQAWYATAPEAERLDYDEWAAAKIQGVVPLGRWQTGGDVAAMIVFLSSRRASEVTGQTINVDGGYVMHW